MMFVVALVVAVVLVPPLLIARAIRAVTCDDCVDDLDTHCPSCDGIDVHDDDDGWWLCMTCRTTFGQRR